jgi:hypothetical protein
MQIDIDTPIYSILTTPLLSYIFLFVIPTLMNSYCWAPGQTAPSHMPDCTPETRRLLLLQILMRCSIYVLYTSQLFNTTGLQNKTVYRICLFYTQFLIINIYISINI